MKVYYQRNDRNLNISATYCSRNYTCILLVFSKKFSFKVITESRIVQLLTAVTTILVNYEFSLESFLSK